MPCHYIKLADGTVAHIRTSKPRARRCRWCDRPGTQLCDYELVTNMDMASRITCDAPMCKAHTTTIRNLEYCPKHAGAKARARLFRSKQGELF